MERQEISSQIGSATALPSISLLEFNNRLTEIISCSPQIRNVWVKAEISDLRKTAAGHCFFELVEKDATTGMPVAKIRASVWAGIFHKISTKFTSVTGSTLTDGIKVLVLISASFHPVFGLSAQVTDIDPYYTIGDLSRIRAEIIDRLTKEGIINQNRRLQWIETPQRIAVISAKNAAGYGDFINQLLSTPRKLRFDITLFPAVMQGDQTVTTIMSALEKIRSRKADFDGVVIIRGGGATSDLAAFENYDLAANIAQFPLPIIVGIGHERDITVLDFVANMRVKTPTAAAEWLISKGIEALSKLEAMAINIRMTVKEILAVESEHLARAGAELPFAPKLAITGQLTALAQLSQEIRQSALNTIVYNKQRLEITSEQLHGQSSAIIERARMATETFQQTLCSSLRHLLDLTKANLDNQQSLVDAYSPMATLRRGYTLTRKSGKIIASKSNINPGEGFDIIFYDGSLSATAD